MVRLLHGLELGIFHIRSYGQFQVFIWMIEVMIIDYGLTTLVIKDVAIKDAKKEYVGGTNKFKNGFPVGK